MTQRKENGPVFLDEKGNPVRGYGRSFREQAAYVAKVMLALMLAIGYFCWRKVATFWDKLVDPTVTTKKPTDEEAKAETLKNARGGIVVSFVLGGLTLLLNEELPTIMVFLTLVISIILMVMSCGTIGIIREGGEDHETIIDSAFKRARWTIIGAVLLVLCLTALAVGIKEGTLLVKYFPRLSEFADWQIGKVNELLEFFANFPQKPGV